jgi:hypothetical protein
VLARHLSEPLRGEAWQQALEATQELSDSTKAKALAEIAPKLPNPLLQQALDAALAIGNERDRAKALAGLAPHLPETLLQEALAAARAIEDTDDRAKALAALAPNLPEPLQEAAWQEALVAAQELLSWTKAKTLAEMVPQIPEPLKEKVLFEALVAARDIQSNDVRGWGWAEPPFVNWLDMRGELLAVLAHYLVELHSNSLHSLWCETLHILSHRNRKDLLSDIRALQPVIARLGGPEAITETFRAVQDVGRWWP